MDAVVRTIRRRKIKKSLLVSDIDGTVVDMWNAWAIATRRAVSRLSYTRALPVAEVERILAETSRTKGISLVDDLGFVIMESPLAGAFDALRAEKVAHSLNVPPELIDEYILRQWWRDRDRFSVLHDAVEPTLWSARKAGARIVLYSDSPLTLVMHRLWASGFHLYLIDAVYCRADPQGMLLEGMPRPEHDSPEDQYYAILRQRCTVFPSTVKKPDRASMQRILDDFGATPQEVVMIGDHAVDIASAHIIPGVTGVWDIDGARVSDLTITQYKRLNQWGHYGIGEASVRQRMEELGLVPDIILDRKFDQLTDYITFVPHTQQEQEEDAEEDARENAEEKDRERDRGRARPDELL